MLKDAPHCGNHHIWCIHSSISLAEFAPEELHFINTQLMDTRLIANVQSWCKVRKLRSLGVSEIDEQKFAQLVQHRYINQHGCSSCKKSVAQKTPSLAKCRTR